MEWYYVFMVTSTDLCRAGLSVLAEILVNDSWLQKKFGSASLKTSNAKLCTVRHKKLVII